MSGADGSIIIDTSIDKSKLNTQLKDLESNLGSLFKGVGTTIAATTVAATAALGAFAVDSGKTFAEFEKGMNEVFTLLPGISQTAMDSMQEQVKDFSKEFGKLPDEVIPALYSSLSAGVPQDNVFEFLEVAQKAAKGGVAELEVAVDGISSVINSYGSEVISAVEASDLMFTAVKNGKTTFEELSGSLFNVIPTASSLGVGFEQITASLASMTAQGVPTSVATTQLRSLLVEMSKSGSDVSDMFKEISGESFQDFMSNGGNLADAMERINDNLEDTDISLMDMFGSVEAGNAALAISGKNYDGFIKNLDDMQGSTGATEKAFDQMNQGMVATSEKVLAQVEVLKVNFGDELAPAVEDGANAILGSLEDLTPAFGDMAEGLVGVFQGSAYGATLLADGVGQVITFLLDTIITAAPMVLDAASQLLLGVAQTLTDSMPVISEAIRAMIPIILDTLLSLVPFIFEIGIELIVALAQGIADYIPQMIETLKTMIPQMVETIITNLPLFIATGIEILTALALGVQDYLPTLLDMIVELIPFMVQILMDNLPLLIQIGIDVILAVITGITEILPELIPVIIDMVLLIINTIIDNLPLILGAAVQIIAALALGLIENLPVIVLAINELLAGLVAAMLNWIEEMVGMGADIIIWLVEGFKGGFDDFFTDAKDLGKNIIDGFWSGIEGQKEALKGKVKDFFGGIIDSAKGVLEIFSPSHVFRDKIGANVVKGTIVGMEDEESDLNTQVKDIFGNMSNVAQSEIDASLSSSVSASTANRSTVNANMTGVLEVDGRKIGQIAFEYLDDNTDLAFGRG